VCRGASGKDFTTAAAFQEKQIKWINEAQIVSKTPENSSNKRFYCGSCNDYIGEDATGVLGIYALPIDAATEPDDMYKPNHHIFYADRVADAQDNLPKWKTLLEGELEGATETAESVQTIDFNKYNSTQGGYNTQTGRYRKDVLPISPTRPAEADRYHFTENDAPVNNKTTITPEKVEARRKAKYTMSSQAYVPPKHKKYDSIVIGGGHNGLTSAAYLAGAGENVLVLERRHIVGGAAVTEEMIPGFKFSRGSYLAGLLRPKVIEDLDLVRHGLKYLSRDPSSFTPSLVDGPNKGKYLFLGDDEQATWESIAQFSKKDADAFPEYEKFLHQVRQVIQPLLDYPPLNPLDESYSLKERLYHLKGCRELIKMGMGNKEVLVPFYELFTGPASQILDRWFESEMLKTTLATDAVIGANISPKHNGSAYVLLHHVMGEAAGKAGVWAYVEGGMGAISNAIAASATEKGAEIVTNASVKRILYTGSSTDAQVSGVEMEDGSIIEADCVLSGTTPYHTFLELLPGLAKDTGFTEEESPLDPDFVHHVRFADYGCGAFKINMAVDKLPNYACLPSPADGSPGPQHMGTAHFENFVEEIENAHREASMGMPATRPVLELTCPSALDNTISPPGKHVVQMFVQYAPYDVDPMIGHWADPKFKEDFVYRCLRIVDEFAPGFSDSVIGYDALSPLDLEQTFGMQKGNIFHSALSLHQLGHARPMSGWSDHRTPLKGLYLVGSGAHPGGGVMGAPGRNGALSVLRDKGKTFSK
jgi:phytoene dehydrogenase-like protein